MSYYAKHILLCTNQKAAGKTCCANSGGAPFFEYLKAKLRELGVHGPGKFRVSQSGCLGRCNEGPCLVVYPEGVWYTYTSFEELDQITEEHLLNQRVVKSLQLPDKPQSN